MAAVSIGLLLGRERPADAALCFALAAAASTLAMLVRGRLTPWLVRVLLLAAITSGGMGWWSLQQASRSPSDLREIAALGEDPRPIQVEGVLLTDPERVRQTPGAMFPGMLPLRHRFELRVRAVGEPSRSCSGVLLASVDGEAGGLRAGDRVKLTAMFRPLEGPLNPGSFDFRIWASDRGIVGRLACPDAQLIRVVAPPGLMGDVESALLRTRAALVRRAVAALDRAFGTADGPGQVRALAMSLLLGRSDAEHAEIDSAFNRLGLSHILAISGFHIVILAAVCLFLVRLAGEWGRLEPVIVAALVIGYLMLVPAGAPVMRAGVMVLVMLVAEMLGRSYDRLTLLGWIGVGLVLWRPGDILTLGFPLSLGLTAALLSLGDVAHERLWGVQLRGTLDRAGRGLVPWTWEQSKGAISTSVLCWSLAFPLILARTGTITPLAILWTLLVTPLVAPAMALGFFVLVIGLIAPGVAGVIGPLAAWPLEQSLALVTTLEQTPGASVRVVGVSMVWAIAATLVVAMWYRVGHWRDARCWAAAGLLLVWLVVLVSRAGELSANVRFRLDALAMGEGTCQVLRVRDGTRTRVLMVDCGSTRTDLGRRVVPDALRELGIARIDRLVLTSPDPSRTSATLDMLRSVPVGEVFVAAEVLRAADAAPTGGLGRLLNELHAQHVPVGVLDAGDGFSIGSARATCLWPPAARTQDVQRDRAMVLRVEAEGRSVLFTSAARTSAIAGLRQAFPELKATIVEAPARGASEHSSIAWTMDLGPAVIVRSTSETTEDPRWDPARAESSWLSTARGAAWVEVLGSGQIRVGQMRAGQVRASQSRAGSISGRP